MSEKPDYIKRREDAAHQKHEARQHEDNVQITVAINALVDQEAADSKKQEIYERDKRRREIVMLCVVAVAAGIALVQMVLLRLQVESAIQQTQLGIISVKIAVQASKDAEKATVEANRAWIAPRGLYIDYEHSTKKGVDLIVEYENIGKEPALNLTFNQYIDDFTGGAPASNNQTAPAIKANKTCIDPIKGHPPSFPMRQGGNEGMMLTMNDGNFLKNFPAMLAGNRTLYFEGCFSYVTFLATHRSAFCYYLRPIARTVPGVARTTAPPDWVGGKRMDEVFLPCPGSGNGATTTFAD